MTKPEQLHRVHILYVRDENGVTYGFTLSGIRNVNQFFIFSIIYTYVIKL